MHNRMRKTTILAALLALAACGGGGGGSDPAGTNPPPADRTPDAFAFESIEDADPGVFYESSITISGLDDGERIPAGLGNIAAGPFELLINDELQDDHRGREVQNGDVVTVRLQASREPEGRVSAEFFAGDSPQVSAVFEVVTKGVSTAAEISLHFPPGPALTDVPLPGAIMLRGGVLPEFDAAQVLVNGETAAFDAETGVWRFEYSVVSGEQAIAVKAVNEAGDEANAVYVLTHVPSTDSGNFGNGSPLGSVRGIVLDDTQDRILYGLRDMFELPLLSGERRKVYDSATGNFRGFSSDLVSAGDAGIYAASYSGDHVGLGLIDPVAGTGAPVSVVGDGKGDDTGFSGITSVAADNGGGKVYLLAGNPAERIYRIWRIDAASAAREVMLDGVEVGPNPRIRFDASRDRLLLAAGSLFEIAADNPALSVLIAEDESFNAAHLAVAPEGNALVIANALGFEQFGLLRVDTTDNSIAVIPGEVDPAFGPTLAFPNGFDVDWARNVAYLATDGGIEYGDRITAIDLETGHRVVVAMEH